MGVMGCEAAQGSPDPHVMPMTRAALPACPALPPASQLGKLGSALPVPMLIVNYGAWGGQARSCAPPAPANALRTSRQHAAGSRAPLARP